MKLIAQVQLNLTPERQINFSETIRVANEACNYLSELAWTHRIFYQFKLQKLCYHDLRSCFNISSQVAIHCIKKVVDAYKKDRRTKRVFSLTGSIAYDARILSWNVKNQTVSIWTVGGRLKQVPFLAGKQQLALLGTQQGESDLICRDGQFYLLATCDVVEPEIPQPVGVLGIDLGIKNIAVTSDGKFFHSGLVKGIRSRHQRLRARLQSKGTRSAKRLLKKRARKERRFMTDINHQISNEIVANAKRTNRMISYETLTNIRDRVGTRVTQKAKILRKQISSWAFGQLRQFIEYKAKRAGVWATPTYTPYSSQECSRCGYCSKLNRKTQRVFKCQKCKFKKHADLNGSNVIKRRGAVDVNLPDATRPYWCLLEPVLVASSVP